MIGKFTRSFSHLSAFFSFSFLIASFFCRNLCLFSSAFCFFSAAFCRCSKAFLADLLSWGWEASLFLKLIIKSVLMCYNFNAYWSITAALWNMCKSAMVWKCYPFCPSGSRFALSLVPSLLSILKYLWRRFFSLWSFQRSTKETIIISSWTLK